MDNCSSTFCPDSNWQASSINFMNTFRNAVLALSETSGKDYQQIPKPFTKRAVYMILVMLVFVLLALAGTAITVAEFLIITRKKTAFVAWVYKFKSFLCCFCVVKNGKKLLEKTSTKDQFECIHGIRFLSNFWVIFLHIFMTYMSSFRTVDEPKPLAQMWISQLLLNGLYPIDAFFVMGGFLNAYLFFGNYDRSNGNISWHYFYFKRFVRLTPVYMVVLGFYTFLFPYLGSGPLWPTFDTNTVCSQSWWWNLLYINNFRNYPEQCMEWCWYLAADMQFYIISPLFLISLQRLPRLGYILAGAVTAASCFANFILTKRYNLVDGMSRVEFYFDDFYSFVDKGWKYFEIVYMKPYTRITSYLIAILLAHYLYKRRFNKIKCNQGVLLIGWIGSGILWYFVYFALYKREESAIETAVFNGVKHLLYSIALSWIIFACVTGQGGIINKFLSWKVFVPLARLSYCAYLVHTIVLMSYYQKAEHVSILSFSSALSVLAYVYFWTYIFSFITSLLFELPFLNMMDLITVKSQTKKL